MLKSSKPSPRLIAFVLVLLALLLAGCGSTAGTPAQAVETYLQAVVATDGNTAVNASCSAWEEQARLDSDAYQGVEAVMENLVCRAVSEDDTSATVSCDGQIRFSYAGGEGQVDDLAGRLFSAVVQDGEWRMCGTQ